MQWQAGKTKVQADIEIRLEQLVVWILLEEARPAAPYPVHFRTAFICKRRAPHHVCTHSFSYSPEIEITRHR